MDYLDGILYVCFLVAAIIGVLLVAQGIDLLLCWRREWKVERYNNAGHRFFDRLK